MQSVEKLLPIASILSECGAVGVTVEPTSVVVDTSVTGGTVVVPGVVVVLGVVVVSAPPETDVPHEASIPANISMASTNEIQRFVILAADTGRIQ